MTNREAIADGDYPCNQVAELVMDSRLLPRLLSLVVLLGRGGKMKRRHSLLIILASISLFLSSVQGQKKEPTDWPTFGNDPGGQRYAQLTQINAENVTKLVRAWTYHMKPAD